MIEIDDTLIGIWFVTLPGNHGFDNWLAALCTLTGGGLRFAHRFRYCDPLEPGADPYENLDRKSEYEGIFTCDREEAIQTVRQVAATLATRAGEPVCELMMNPERDVPRFTRELMAQPWAQPRAVKHPA